MSGIRARLLLLVGLAIVPLFLFTLYQGFEERRRAATRERAEARQLAQLFAAEQRRVVADARRLLFVLAQGPTIRRADSAASAQLFRDILGAFPEYTNVLLVYPDGGVIAGAQPDALDADDRALVARAAASTFALGRIRLVGSSPFPTFAAAHAVAADGDRRHVLLARAGMRWIADEFAVAGLGSRTRLTLWDSSGQILLRYPDPESFLGRDASGSAVFRAIRASGGDGTAEAEGADGIPRLYGFARLTGAADSEVILSLGVPTDVALADLRRLEQRNLSLLALATVLGAAVAWRGGERLVRVVSGLQKMAERDPLTGLANRRRLLAAGQEEHRRARRLGHPLAALMLDLDHFKLVNDRHGHGAGDDVLREVARRIQETVREIDLPARYGGEEFAVLLPDTRVDKAREVAERIRLAVAASPIQTRKGPLPVTLSAGIAVVHDDEGGGNLTSLFEAADSALYRAKAAGRNRVSVAAG